MNQITKKTTHKIWKSLHEYPSNNNKLSKIVKLLITRLFLERARVPKTKLQYIS
jgi:hypothetical protein